MKKGREEILIIATGGTIEAPRYPKGYENEPVFNNSSIIPDLLLKNKYNYPYKIEIPFLKDSRYLNDSDREILVGIIKSASHKRIMISHGTMTLSETHAYLQAKSNLFPEKTVVLFGANQPWNLFNTDAGINTGFALGTCLYAPPQVYIAMNGILIKSLSCKIDGVWKEF
jgi:L-asparaginase/Glu-tRNA(Gln) amidotransferase subunit D